MVKIVIICILVLALLIVGFLWIKNNIHFGLPGLSGGSLFGKITNADTSVTESPEPIIEALNESEKTVNSKSPNDLETPDISQPLEIIIDVIEDEYHIEGKEVTLDDIRELIVNSKPENTFVIRDNYGSIKTWDDLTKLLYEMKINYVEE